MAIIRIEGLADLVEGLEREWATAKTKGAQAVDHTAAKIEETSKELAPKGDRPHKGQDLAPSIHKSGTGTYREVGPSARHGVFVENGTYKDAPQPFMGPAADMHEDELVEELTRLVGEL